MTFLIQASELIVIRKPLKSGFTQISNTLIRDSELNWKATGMLIYLLSLPPLGYKISIERLCMAKKDGEASVRSTKELLEKLGYLKIIKVRNSAGRYCKTQWFVKDEPGSEWNVPELGNPVLDNPVVEFPETEKQRHINTDVININKELVTTTTTAKAEVIPVFSDNEKLWLWLCSRIGFDQEKTLPLFIGLSGDTAIDILAELYSCKKQGGIKKTESQFLNSLIRAAHSGQFKLSAGLSLRADLPKIIIRQEVVKAESGGAVCNNVDKSIAHQKAMLEMNVNFGIK